MRSIRISTLVLALAATAQLASACAFRSALGNMVVTSAAVEATTTAHAPEDAQAATAAEVSNAQGGEFRWSERMAAGRVIEVRGVNGRVQAEGTTGSEVEVVATKSARRSNPESVRIEVVRHAEGVTVCAVYPSSNADKPNSCGPGGSGSMNVKDNDVQVDFAVRVPACVRFAGRTVNGGVEATGLQADAEAYAVNGGVRVSTTGLARASTVNGSVIVEMGRADWQDELEFQTVNGQINVLFPATLSADVRAETLNGSISTDFPMTVQGSAGRRRLEGVIGGGGRTLRLRTVNGGVEIRRGS